MRTTNYVFDLDRFISFEGKTGPYLLYATVRMKSLARRAADEGVTPGAFAIELDAERGLVLALDGFGDAMRGAYEKRLPHILCDHAYTLAQAFSAFYAAAPILAEKDASQTRLALRPHAGDAETAGARPVADRDRDARPDVADPDVIPAQM